MIRRIRRLSAGALLRVSAIALCRTWNKACNVGVDTKGSGVVANEPGMIGGDKAEAALGDLRGDEAVSIRKGVRTEGLRLGHSPRECPLAEVLGRVLQAKGGA